MSNIYLVIDWVGDGIVSWSEVYFGNIRRVCERGNNVKLLVKKRYIRYDEECFLRFCIFVFLGVWFLIIIFFCFRCDLFKFELFVVLLCFLIFVLKCSNCVIWKWFNKGFVIYVFGNIEERI